jgi:hypothetical protein
MKRICLVLLVLVGIMVFQGCTKKWEEENTYYHSPCWTPSGKIVYFEHWYKNWKRKNAGIGEETYKQHHKYFLKEMDASGGNDRVILNLFEYEIEQSSSYPTHLGNIAVSSSRIAFAFVDGMNHDTEKRIWTVNKKGTELNELCKGGYPNFFAGGDSIIFEKPDGGIWVMDANGDGLRQEIADSRACQPDMNGNDKWIIFVRINFPVIDSLFAYQRDSLSTIFMYSYTGLGGVDVAACFDSVKIEGDEGIKVFLIGETMKREIPLLDIASLKWSPSGDRFVGSNMEGIYVVNSDGTSKRRLK